jgi:hypothetical protein
MHKALPVLIVALLSTAAYAQNTAAEVKAQGDVDRAAIKANEKTDRALTKEAEANVDADAKADKKKLKGHGRGPRPVTGPLTIEG